MNKITIKCDWAECDFTLGEVQNDAANLPALVELLQTHTTTRHQNGESSSSGTAVGKPEKAKRPEISVEMSEQDCT